MHAKTVLLVYHRQPQIAEFHIPLEQGVGRLPEVIREFIKAHPNLPDTTKRSQ